MGNCVEVTTSNQDSVDNILSESKNFEYIVFSKSTCPECIKTRTILFSLNSLPKIIELSRTQTKLKKSLSKVTNKEKPPYIFYKGDYIGGLEELERHLKKSKIIL